MGFMKEWVETPPPPSPWFCGGGYLTFFQENWEPLVHIKTPLLFDFFDNRGYELQKTALITGEGLVQFLVPAQHCFMPSTEKEGRTAEFK